MQTNRTFLTIVSSAVAGPAFAHPGSLEASSFASGILHPLAGLDHVLVMIAVGLLSVLLRGRALWAMPLTFVGMLVIGGLLGLAGVVLPGAEVGISISVVVLGLMIMAGKSWPIESAFAVVGGFAVFHGFAHGAEMPAAAGAALYTFGFVAATILLHGVGVLTGFFASAHRLRFAGAALALAGAALAVT